MKVVIASDSYKESLKAIEVCEELLKGALQQFFLKQSTLKYQLEMEVKERSNLLLVLQWGELYHLM